jgi:uncharacterized protein YbcC (UPF0753/DUF2309 family)
MATEREELGSTELLRKLRLAIANQPDEVPEGWKTANQWSDEWGISPNAAGIILNRSARLGIMECRKFRILSGGRGVYPVQHYREVAKA